MEFRLHIDIPVGIEEKDALQVAQWIIDNIYQKLDDNHFNGKMNYRLGHDEDRQKSNYFNKNENGHINNKKIRVEFIRGN